MKEKEWKKWIFWFSFAVAAIVVYKAIDSVSVIFSEIGNFLGIITPFFMAALLAYMLYIPGKGIEKRYKKSRLKFLKNHARGLSVITVYIAVITFIFVVYNFIMPAVSASITDLANNLPNYYTNAIEFLEKVPEDSIIAKIGIADSVKSLETINIMQEITKWLDTENIILYIKNILSATGIIFDLFVIVVVSIYLLLERDDIKSFVKNVSKAMFDKKTNDRLTGYYHKTNKIFFTFVTSQILDAFIVGTITSIAMCIMKVKYGLLLGFLIGLFNVIPYFGAIVAVIIAVIITIFTGGFMQALWLAIVVIILQQIDANIINPRILGTSLNLSPILVIFAVTIGGAYFGVIGMFLGVPVCALLKIILMDIIDAKNAEKALQEKKASQAKKEA